MKNQNIVIYQNETGKIKVDVRFEDESIWLTHAQLFGISEQFNFKGKERFKIKKY